MLPRPRLVLPRLVVGATVASLALLGASRAEASAVPEARPASPVPTAAGRQQPPLAAGAARSSCAPRRGAVTDRTVQRRLRTIHEAEDAHASFTRTACLRVPSRGGRALTVVLATRYPTSDARGQAVFVWSGTSFLGVLHRTEVHAIADAEADGPGRFRVRYLRYAAGDALCCPSMSPQVIRYRYDGSRMRASARLQASTGAGSEPRVAARALVG